MTKAPRKTEAKEPAEAEKPAAKAAPKGKKIDKPAPGNKPNALQQPLEPSDELAAIIGAGTFPRGEVVSKIWEYIKANKLQSPDDGRQIIADKKLETVFGKKEVSMFEMNKLISAHLTKPE